VSSLKREAELKDAVKRVTDKILDDGFWKVPSHYPRCEVRIVRFMTREEAKALSYGDHVLFLDRNNHWINVKVNGKPRTWKRDPLRVEVPLKYGMYEYFSACFDSNRSKTDLIVEKE